MFKLHILQILDRVEGYGMAVTTLRTELEMVRRVKCGEHELQAAIADMRNAGLLTDSLDDLTGDTLWQLTPAGTARARH